MNIAPSLMFAAITATFILGVIVIRTNPRRPANQAFLLFSFLSGLWLTCLGAGFYARDTATATLFMRISHSIGALIPVLCDWLRLAITHRDKKLSQIAGMEPVLLTSALFFSFFSHSPMMIAGSHIPDGLNATTIIPEIVFGKFYPLYPCFFTIMLCILGYRFWKSHRLADGMQRAELDFACFGGIVSMVFALFVSILIPLFTGNFQSIVLSPLSVMILNIMIAYGIATRRIMDMATLIRLFIAYALLSFCLALLYFSVWSFVAFFLRLQGISSRVPAGLLASIVVAFSLTPAHGFMHGFADRIFARTGAVNMQSMLQLTNRLLYSISTIEALLADFSTMIRQIMGTDKVCVLLVGDGVFEQKYPLPSPMNNPLNLDRNSTLPQVLAGSDTVIVPAILRRLNPKPDLAAACKTIEDYGFSAAISIGSSEGLKGILLLGPKLSGLVYSVLDQQGLQLLCNQLAIAMNNARLYTEAQNAKIYNDLLVDSLASGVIAADTHSNLTVLNREAQRILRCSSAPTNLNAIHPALADVLSKTLSQGQGVRDSDIAIQWPDNSETPVRVSSSVFYSHTGQMMGAFLVVNDLTTIRQLELQVRRTDRLASIGTLAAGMAHEIKNPLVSVKTFTQLLPERFDDADFRETFTSLVGDEVKRIDAIVNQLLRFSRPSKPVLVPTHLHDVITHTTALMKQQLRQKDIQLHQELRASSDMISADAHQLGQALVNFFLNAIEAMDGAGILTVSTTLNEGDYLPFPPDTLFPSRHIVLTIRDSGTGIAPEDITRIFDPFFTTKTQGTGLGLSVAHGIIHEHNGFIDVKSEPGAGTLFIIRFPLLSEESHSS